MSGGGPPSPSMALAVRSWFRYQNQARSVCWCRCFCCVKRIDGGDAVWPHQRRYQILDSTDDCTTSSAERNDRRDDDVGPRHPRRSRARGIPESAGCRRRSAARCVAKLRLLADHADGPLSNSSGTLGSSCHGLRLARNEPSDKPGRFSNGDAGAATQDLYGCTRQTARSESSERRGLNNGRVGRPHQFANLLHA